MLRKDTPRNATTLRKDIRSSVTITQVIPEAIQVDIPEDITLRVRAFIVVTAI
jgi:hypothetical protein